MQPDTGIQFSLPSFTRNFFTTGVVITHPALSKEGVDCAQIAELLYEAFLMHIPFERQDIGFAIDKHRATYGPIEEGKRFIAFYDQTYGSLRLSSRLMEDDWLMQITEKAVDLWETQPEQQRSPANIEALRALEQSAKHQGHEHSLDNSDLSMNADSSKQAVILPGSKGLIIDTNCSEEFEITSIFFHPQSNTLRYRGKRDSLANSDNVSIVPISSVIEIPGISDIGYYDYETGETLTGKI